MKQSHILNLLLIFCSLICFSDRAAAQMQATADFVGGSAVIVSTDAEQQSVHLQPEVRQDRGWPCWWYCRLDGLTVGTPVELSVSANPAPYRERQVLSQSWLLPDRASISDDNVSWRHTPEADRKGKAATYTFEATAKTMWVGWGPPFLPSHAEKLLKEVAETLPGAELFELARTRGNRPVNAIRFGAQESDDVRPSAIWIQARQHAWEAGSSWVAQGFLRWAASDDPIAADLRSKATIYVVPIMDVDNVAIGAGGKASVPRDHNRDWDDKPIYTEVLAAQSKIKQLLNSHRFDAFIDLHNPGPNDRKPFYFAPKMDGLPKLQQRNYMRWRAISESLIEGIEPEFRFTGYIKTQEERDRVSSNWVRNHTTPHVVSMTLETSWNRSEGTQQGYQSVGEQLGLTIARYLNGDPSAD